MVQYIKFYLDSIFVDEIAATSKSSTADKKTSSGDKSGSAAQTGGSALKLKPLSNLVAPTKPKPAEPAPAGLSSFLDKVILALKKTGAGPGPAPKPNNLQLPSLNSEEDDTPPMPAAERRAVGPLPMHSLSSSRGVSPPRSSETNFDTDNLINDSDVVQILSELDQVRDVVESSVFGF